MIVLGASSRHAWRVGLVIGAVLLVDVGRIGPVATDAADRPPFGAPSIAVAAGTSENADVDDAAREADAKLLVAQEAVASARARRRTAERTLRQRVEETARAQRATLAVDEGVRTAEEQIIEAVVHRWETEIELAHAEHAATAAAAALRRHRAELVSLRHRQDLVRRALAEARVALEERTIRAYKHGSVAASTGWMLGAAREASSPGDLAAATKHLERLSEDSSLDVERLEGALVTIEADLVRVTARRDRAVVERDRTAAELEVARREREQAIDATAAAERVAAERRLVADRAEARRLAAWQRALDAEAAAATRLEQLWTREVDARDALASMVGAGASALPGIEQSAASRSAAGDPDGGDDDASLEDRRAWLRSRQRALARNHVLAAEARHADDAWVCPVVDGRFVNDWGFPRSQVRRHQGTDVFAPDGTPVRSPVDGIVSALDAVDRFDGRRDLGGITVTVQRGSERFYHAHLQGIAPGLRVGDPVTAGAMLGAVGRTGNARGTAPHLHFGWYVDDVAVNPYASLAMACGDWLRPSSERDQPPSS